MQKKNIIDLGAYRKQSENAPKLLARESELSHSPVISRDLELAIQNLILQLREFGPIKPKNS